MCLIPAAARAGAAEPAVPDTVFVVPGIVVEAPRVDPHAYLFNRPGFVAVVDVSEQRDRAQDLSDVLGQMLGVRVKQYGGMGGFATASIRGSSASQVNIYVDGIPVSDPYLGVTNLADLPLGGVGRVEVYRGFSPPEFGASAIGGAVNLVTTTEEDWRRDRLLSAFEVYESAGSFGSRRHHAAAWSSFASARMYVQGSYTTSRGDFTFHDDNDTGENAFDDTLATRANNDLTAWNIVSRGEIGLNSAGKVILGYDDTEREQGVPGRGAYQSDTARSRRRHRRAVMRYESIPLWNHRVRAWANGFYAKSNERYSDPNGDIALIHTQSDNTIRAYGGGGRVKLYVPRLPLSVEGVFEGRREQFHPVEDLPTRTEGPDRWRRSQTTAVTGEVYLLGQSLVVSTTARFESHSDEFYDDSPIPTQPPTPRGRFETSTRSPSAGVRWRAASWLTIKGNVGRYYRLPTFLELFGQTGSVSGNSNLVPERGLNRDVGLIITGHGRSWIDRTLLEVSYLDNDVDDLILFFPNSQFTSRPTNISSARIRGWEMSASARLGGRLDAAVNYARLDARDTGPIPYYHGNRLPSRPRDDLSVSASYRWRILRGTVEYHYLGSNYLNRANHDAVAARHLANAALRVHTPLTGLALTVEARNITDNQISDVAGFPLPGRAFFTTLGYSY